jgi:tetratricopeptide (TPR) repeat protein
MSERMCRSIQTEILQDWFQLPLDEVVGVKAPAFRVQEKWLLGVPVLNVEPKTFCKLRRESEESLLAVLRRLQFAFPPTSLNRDCLLVQVDISDVQATDFSAPDTGLRYQPEDGLVRLVRGIDDLFARDAGLVDADTLRGINFMSDQNSNWRARPVFISSTFKDMQAERDYLRSHIFPRLEERLRERHHYFEPIDLRLGVESAESGTEEARELLVLKVCLDEIQRSRPFLIVILGDRYGWVPPPERMRTATREVGFTTEVRGKSVTALEIEFGVLKEHPDQRQRCFLYFRKPLPYDRMPLEVAQQYSDALSSDPGVRGGHRQLQALKEHILADPELGPSVHAYDATWDPSTGRVTGLQEWGEMVFQHLRAVLDEETRDFVSQPPQTLEQRERAALNEFTVQCSRDFTGREELLAQLLGIVRSAAVDGATWGVCVTGSAGSGKSAVLAELYQRLATDDGPLILANAAGATPRGAEPDAMLRRFIGELATALGIDDPLPKNAGPDDVDATFASLLTRAAQQRRVIVLLDALDQFDPTPRGQHLSWLRARQWPANARIIATGITGTAPVDALIKNNGVETIDLPALEAPEVTKIARFVWARYHRQVNPEVLRTLEGKKLPDGSSAAGNPLWLTLALEQLNLLDADDFARAEREFTGSAAERLHALLVDTATRMPSDVPELYGWLLEQTEKTFGAPHARAFAVLIAFARFGWRESDLLALVPTAARLLFPQKTVPAFDELSLASIRRAFRAHLIRRGADGQLDFFHAQMRQAVQARILDDGKQVKAIHRAIADHLVSLAKGDPLRERELMVHLIKGDDAEHAAQMLANVEGTYSLSTAFGFSASTHVIQALARHISLGDTERPSANLQWVIKLLAGSNLSSEQIGNIASRFNSDLDAALANTTDLGSRRIVIGSAKDALQRLANDDPANNVWQHGLSLSLNILGNLAKAQGDLDSARHYFDESRTVGQHLATRRAASNSAPQDLFIPPEEKDHITGAQGQQASALNWNSFLENEVNLQDVESIDAQIQSIDDQINELKARQKRNEDEMQELRAEDNTSRLAEQEGLCASLDYLGDIAVAQGDLTSALRYFNDSKAIREQIAASDPYYAQWLRDLTVPPNELSSNLWIPPSRTVWQNNLAVSLGRLGNLAMRRGDLADASRNLIESQAILERIIARDPTNIQGRQLEWQFNLAKSNVCLGDIAEAKGDMAEASRRYSASKVVFERLVASNPSNTDWQRGLALSLSNLGHIAMKKGDMAVAMGCFKESHAIFERNAAKDPTNTERQRDLCMSDDNLATLAHAQGDIPEALRLRTAVNEIVRRLAASSPTDAECQRGLAVSQRKIGEVLGEQGDFAGALAAYREALAIWQRLAATDPSNAGWQSDLWVTCWMAAAMAENTGSDEAAKWWRKAYETLSAMKLRGIMPPTDEQYLVELKENLELSESATRGASATVHIPNPLAQRRGEFNVDELDDSGITRVHDGLATKDAAGVSALPSAPVDIPAPQPGADKNRAAIRNLRYKIDLKRWRALPFWKRLRAAKPKPPKGI